MRRRARYDRVVHMIDPVTVLAAVGAGLVGAGASWGTARALGQFSAKEIEKAAARLERAVDLVTRLDERVSSAARSHAELAADLKRLDGSHDQLRREFTPVQAKCEVLWHRSGIEKSAGDET